MKPIFLNTLFRLENCSVNSPFLSNIFAFCNVFNDFDLSLSSDLSFLASSIRRSFMDIFFTDKYNTNKYNVKKYSGAGLEPDKQPYRIRAPSLITPILNI